MTKKYPLFDEMMDELLKPRDYYVEVRSGCIYDDTPRPKWWKHPIKWWKWKPDEMLIGYIDLDDPGPIENGITVTFDPEETKNG